MASKTTVVADEVEDPSLETPEPERSVREELEASLAEVNARHESETPESASTEAPAAGRSRDATGRFAARAGDESRAAPTEPADRAAHPAVAQPPAAVEPPQGWSAQEKTIWGTVPPAAQAAIHRRELDFHRKLTEHDEVRSVGNQFMQAANEYAPLIQARGGNPAGLFREFLGILHALHTGDAPTKQRLLRQVAAQNGVSFDAPAHPGQAPSPASQPNFQLPPPVLQTVQEWNQFKARQEQEARVNEAREMQQTTNEIEAFRSDPAHPHFAAVTGLMTSILRSEVASTLEEAYQLAVKAHPETSQLLAGQATAQRQAEEAARQRAAAARRKSGSVRSGPGGAPPSTLNGSKGSVRDDLKAAFEDARGRI